MKAAGANSSGSFASAALPQVLLSDNGPPFASLAAGGLRRLSVWWIKLGITPVRIMPGVSAGAKCRLNAEVKSQLNAAARWPS
jgi:hypothetical protein